MRFLVILFLSSALTAPPREWKDSIRDVYIDGSLDRSAQTLVTSSPRMFAVVCGDRVLIIDPDSKSVSEAPRSSFTLSADRLTATSATDPRGTTRAPLVNPNDSTYFAMVDGKSVVVSAHQSKAGPMSLDELWTTAPVWRAIADTYEPDAAVIERLRAIDEPVRLQIVMATWCGDSRYHVPRLLKSIERAANPNLSVELIGIGPDFDTPMDIIAGQNITNVPTVIVQRGGKELGRYVETPAAATIEDDIADITRGTQKPHPGGYKRGALITSGTYLLRDSRHRHAGTERFEIYERPGGGNVVHSLIGKRDGTSVETWAAIDDTRRAKSIETTHRGSTTTRTRYRADGEAWFGWSRGASGGIVEQRTRTPPAVVTPATVTYAWARDAAQVYIVPESGVGAVGNASFKVAAGVVPKFVKFADGSDRVLVRQP